MLVLLMRGIFNYIVEMGLGAVIYVPSFIKVCLGIQKLIWGGGDKQTHSHIRRQQRNLISLRLFFKNKESRLKMAEAISREEIKSNLSLYILC
jgi:hypothetical protein